MKNSARHLVSLGLLGTFFIIATATLPAPWWEKDECASLEALVVNYPLTIHVVDRVTGEPVPGLDLFIKVSDWDAQIHNNVDFRREICRLYINDVQEFNAITNGSGTAVVTPGSFTHDSSKDRTDIIVDIIDPEGRYSFAPQSTSRFGHDASPVQITVRVLDNSLL